jgi:hypothetical protein
LILIQILTGCSWPMHNFCPTHVLDGNEHSPIQKYMVLYPNEL